ncbi:cytochrome c family protein [Tropicibacter oceani]|uniref:Cytochrome c domain-containing protein n=1 Tax=Tropicibacter oceani TaxID=3058420 RepID=A0ABY8QLM9_9RHOB|nr:hypothetical protein [Tropicibacter oceani]WGW05549.1 hypothetical protein QF118_08380 [Tropicibacter oceani]
MVTRWILICLALLVPFTAQAQEERLVRLAAPEALHQSGLLKHILPRFSLKTQVRVSTVAPGDPADMVLGDTGRALFEGAGQVWHMTVLSQGHAPTQRFADWLTSEVGRNTVTSFAPDGTPLFTQPQPRAATVAAVTLDGDSELGQRQAQLKCGRCHAVRPEDRFNSIGSTPSFMVLRGFPDWAERFSVFYVLNPHPAFTQIADVSDPFPIDRPSPIAPVEMTLAEVEALLAYVQRLAPADLGAPIQSQ